MLAKGPSQGCQLRARLDRVLGPLGDAMNAGHIYVQLGRLEKAGLVTREGTGTSSERPDPKVYVLTPAGEERVTAWLSEMNWPKPDLTEFHLKLIGAAAAGLTDPISIVDGQRRELLQQLRDVQRAALAEPDRSNTALLLEGIAFRLQADLRWLEMCGQQWIDRRSNQ